MFIPPPSPTILPTSVRSLSPQFIALSTVLAVFLLLTICIFLRLLVRHVRAELHPTSAPIPQSLPRDPIQEPTVSRLALADLLGVRGSGSSLSDIDSAAPLFYVDDNRPSVSSEDENESSTEDVCAVCLEALQAGQRARRLPCRHVYHDPCAVVWLVKADRCPVCAQPVVHKDRQPHDSTPVTITDRRPQRSVPRRTFLTSLFRVRR